MIKLAPLVAPILNEYTSLTDVSKIRSVLIKEEAVKQLLRTSFSKAARIYAENREFGLYRGYATKSALLHYYVDPTTKARESTGTNNFYTSFISTSPRWRDYPRRNHSVIAATSYNTAVNYGDSVFYVVPENGAKFAFCDAPDCWNSFTFARKLLRADDVSDVSLAIIKFFESVGHAIGKKSFDSFSKTSKLMEGGIDKFIKIIDTMRGKIIDNLDVVIRDTEHTTSSSMTEPVKRFAKLVKRYPSFRELFEDMFDPKKNNIKLVSDIDALDLYGDLEFWTDVKCLLVPLTNRRIFKDALTGAIK